MSDQEIDLKSKYTEGCSALRHYSICVLNTRTVTIAQGFLILTAAVYLIRDRLFAASLAISFFGLLFTIVLNRLQMNYWIHFNSILETVVRLENPTNANNSVMGPWSAYHAQRNERHLKIKWKILVVYGPYYLLTFALAIIVIYNLVMLTISAAERIHSLTIR